MTNHNLPVKMLSLLKACFYNMTDKRNSKWQVHHHDTTASLVHGISFGKTTMRKNQASPAQQGAKILVIGQTPPPYGGQAMMTQRLVNARFSRVHIYHIRMAFSRSTASIGRIELGKLWHMLVITAQAIFFRWCYGIRTLYYMPAGPGLTPVFRDFFILFFLRMCYPKVVFHFRAAGLSDFIAQQPALVKSIAHRIYGHPDLAIHLTSVSPDDGGYFRARKRIVINNGLEDAALPYLPIRRLPHDQIKILFVGVITESKGIFVFLEAIAILRSKGYPVQAELVGSASSEKFFAQVLNFCRSHHLLEMVNFTGVRKDAQKWKCFLGADIFCFPTFFESESMSSVVVEAMMFELPVVTTRWRGLPDIVRHEQTGFLAPVQDALQTAAYLERLINDEVLRLTMGKQGRAMFLSHFQLPRFLTDMEASLYEVATT